jgi:hypothetical protein
MNATEESLRALVDKGIIGLCEKHGEKVYFDASQDCPVCTVAKPLPKVRKKLNVKEVIKPPEPIEDLEKDESITGRIREYVLNPKNKGTIIILVVGLIGLIWLYLNYPAIMSYFAR